MDGMMKMGKEGGMSDMGREEVPRESFQTITLKSSDFPEMEDKGPGDVIKARAVFEVKSVKDAESPDGGRAYVLDMVDLDIESGKRVPGKSMRPGMGGGIEAFERSLAGGPRA